MAGERTMKHLTKAFVLMTVMATMVACGKNTSGGSAGSSTSPVSNQNLTTHAQIKSYYQNKSYADGVNSNTKIYRSGTYYGAPSVQVSMNFSGCIDLGFWSAGDCDQSESLNNYLNDNIDNGDYFLVNSATANDINIDLAVNAVGGDYIYQSRDISKSDNDFRDMLALDDDYFAVVSKATVQLGNRSIKADYIEYFSKINGQYIASYVLSTDVPLVANPLYVGVAGEGNGRLQSLNNEQLGAITVSTHYRQNTGNGFRTVSAGPAQI